jgi:predicted nucleic acid-binding protein
MNVVINTNAFIRFFTDDDAREATLVEKLLKDEKTVIIPDVVLPELAYVLMKEYQFSREKLLKVYMFLFSKDNFYLTNAAKKAIGIFAKSKLDMADCIIAAYSLKGKLASFDQELVAVEEVQSYWKK